MALLAEISATPWIFLLLMLGVIGWLLFRITRRINQKETLRPTPRMTNTAHSLGTAPPPELNRWGVEMQDLTRDALAQIDTKMRALDYLTTQATAAAQRLEAAIANQTPASRDPSRATQPDATTDVAPMSHASSELPDSPVSTDLPDTHSQADVLERTTGRTHDDEASQGVVAGDAESRRRQIYEMADRGVDLAAIATALGSPMGEIELILGLRRQGA